MHAMDDPQPVLEEPEFNGIDFQAVMIFSEVFKVSHMCKCLAEPKHPSFECQALRSPDLSLQANQPLHKPPCAISFSSKW